MTISQHSAVLDVGGVLISPRGGQVAVDESWSPYVQSTLTIALPAPAVFAALDPRRKSRVRLTLRKAYGEDVPVSGYTAAYTGRVAAVTSDLAGAPLSLLSQQFGVPYNAFGGRPSSTRTFDLGVRQRDVDYLSGVVTLDLASDEALLWDYAPAETGALTPAAPTVRSAVAMVLAYIGSALEPGPADGPIAADALAWEPGIYGWEYLLPLVNAAGLRLWCDESRRWRLTKPLAPTEGALYLGEDAVTRVEDQVSRDDGWYDAVVVKYTWKDSAGVERVAYDTAAEPAYSRVMTVEHRDRRFPGAGAAAAILARSRGRGHAMSVETVADYSTTPGQILTLTLPLAPIQTGLVSRVRWSLEDDGMQVGSRDLIDTPPGAWALTPAGYRWADVPAGQTWPNFTQPTEV